MRIESSGTAKVFFPARSREEIVERLHACRVELGDRIGLTRMVLFGSYARGDETAASDIDVLVVCSADTREDAYAVVRDVVGLRGLELHVYSVSEARRNAPVLERMTREGIEIK